MSYKISERQLDEQEINELISGIKQTPFIIGYNKKEWLDFEKVYVAEMKDKIMGVCAIKKINSDWSEIIILFIFAEFRKQGIGKLLF